MSTRSCVVAHLYAFDQPVSATKFVVNTICGHTWCNKGLIQTDCHKMYMSESVFANLTWKIRFSLHREKSLWPFYHGNESVDTVETSKQNSSLRVKLKSAPQCLQIKEPSKSKIESKQQNIEGRVSTLLQCLRCIPTFLQVSIHVSTYCMGF